MATFLNTTGISSHLEDMIKGTKEKLVLISPYLQFNERIKEFIHDLNILKYDIRIVYRENKLQLEENNWLESQIGVRTFILKNLHAKCYINESEAIITSMNLYSFSQSNNNEMGIYITKAHDTDLYNQVFEEAQRLLRISEEIRVTVKKVISDSQQTQSNAKVESTLNKPATGYCIRTGVEIPFNIEKPMSNEAYKSWSKYGDADYSEKFCHFSGEPSHGETSVNKPILKKHWKKAKEIYAL